MTASAVPPQIVHGTCVALQGRGLLILGPSGAGKSALGLELMAYGALLVADDRTHLVRQGNDLVASCPAQIAGKIEARGIGILAATRQDFAPIILIVDLSQTETERLPPKRQLDLLGVPIDLVFGSTSRHFPFGILQFLRTKRVD
ncbi:HPr kinase/phosphorylase [Pseudorhodobacter sp. W20_MBD10_FR17]|uniref:HPr kinase/phosphorylase n=1 Tax=Pseudorhodobacter sp. W20_MBD10_FR17 TaxID=3240266 RepID=UPI003F9B772C